MNTKRPSLDDLIQREARHLATRFLETELAKQNLPLPKDSNLDLHLDALLAANPQLAILAQERVEAQQDAYSQALATVGVEALAPGRILDLDDPSVPDVILVTDFVSPGESIH